MRYISYLIFLIIVVAGITFAILNSDPVTVHYYTGSRQLPLSVLLVGCFVLGVFLGVLLMAFKTLGLHFRVAKLKRQLATQAREQH